MQNVHTFTCILYASTCVRLAGMLLFCSACGACGACGVWATGENHQGDNRLAHAGQASTLYSPGAFSLYTRTLSLKRYCASAVPSTPCSSLMRSYSAEGEQLQCVANNCNALWTIAMRCEQLQCVANNYNALQTIAMRCEQLQYNSSTNARNFTVHCIPCKSHYALAWGALVHCAHVATYLQYEMYNTSKASIAYIQGVFFTGTPQKS